jgi:hypothetical protein
MNKAIIQISLRFPEHQQEFLILAEVPLSSKPYLLANSVIDKLLQNEHPYAFVKKNAGSPEIYSFPEGPESEELRTQAIVHASLQDRSELHKARK